MKYLESLYSRYTDRNKFYELYAESNPNRRIEYALLYMRYMPLNKNAIKMKEVIVKDDSETIISKSPEYARELEGKVYIIKEIIEYLPNEVVSRTIIKKLTGNITVSSFDAGEELAEKHFSFDAFIQIIDGSAELTINDKLYTLKVGGGIIIPAHAKHHFKANIQFKMISTVIKSGYECF